ncbi:unnamed protein product [Cuscuta epithymum]|uniref:Uncharacterized protein n=1 Tax=Cuscuta epithymum TaxID=186058 RepID=A0AAV0C4Q4_9ASTE|nr:unnamed protein product [Cuscuta epithymum]
MMTTCKGAHYLKFKLRYCFKCVSNSRFQNSAVLCLYLFQFYQVTCCSNMIIGLVLLSFDNILPFYFGVFSQMECVRVKGLVYFGFIFILNMDTQYGQTL